MPVGRLRRTIAIKDPCIRTTPYTRPRIYIRGYGSIRGQNEIISLCKWTRRTKLVARPLPLACFALVFHPLSLFPRGKAGRKKTSRIIGANPFSPFSLSPRPRSFLEIASPLRLDYAHLNTRISLLPLFSPLSRTPRRSCCNPTGEYYPGRVSPTRVPPLSLSLFNERRNNKRAATQRS